jgi:hypothetical protein
MKRWNGILKISYTVALIKEEKNAEQFTLPA